MVPRSRPRPPARDLSLGLGLALLLALPAAAPAAHPHYEGLLREGIFALERGDAHGAVEDLRLACFGLLDEPEALAGCLVHLGLAEAALGDDPAFRDTFRRLAQVEERFGAYTAAELPPAARAAFEAEVRSRVPPAMLEATPAFARLAAVPEAAPSGPPVPAPPPPPAEPGPGAAAAGAVVAGEPPTAPAPGLGEADLGSPAGAPEEPIAPPAPVAAPAAEAAPPAWVLPDEDRALLDRARDSMAAARTRQDLEEPFTLAREVADAYPASRTAQYLAAEIAYRAARWPEAVTYFRRGGDPADGNPMLLFYLAVSLYETGEQEAAADALRRSLPRIEQTPFVISYRERILGEEAAPPAPEGRR